MKGLAALLMLGIACIATPAWAEPAGARTVAEWRQFLAKIEKAYDAQGRVLLRGGGSGPGVSPERLSAPPDGRRAERVAADDRATGAHAAGSA